MPAPEDVFLLLGADADAVVANVEGAHCLLSTGWDGILIANLYPARLAGR
jgi:hypothetical protein